MTVGHRTTAYVRHGGYIYPSRHWAELSRFAVGDERDPRGLFSLADDIWEAWPYAEAGRPTTAADYRFYFSGLHSFLKLYVKWYCYERLLILADTSWSAVGMIAHRLIWADRFIQERGFISLDDIASQTAFEELWVATVIGPAADGETQRTKAPIRPQAQNRQFWLRLRSYFGAPHVIPPAPLHTSKLPTEYADDRAKVIPNPVIKQLVNKLALHRDGVDSLNRFNHLRLCVIILAICVGRRIGELLSAPRGVGTDGPLRRAPARGGPEEGALWFRYTPSKRGSATEVYISTEWEDVATYCVRELLKYSDEIRERAHPKEARLLILVSTANLTARKKASDAAANATVTPIANGTEAPMVSGLRTYNLRHWLNGVKSGKVSDGVLKKWGITTDGRAESPIYDLGLTFARHTRQSALALNPQISPRTSARPEPQHY
jgi:hypothetical protein